MTSDVRLVPRLLLNGREAVEGVPTAAIGQKATPPELLKTEQVAQLCEVGERTVWRWSHTGRMPAPLKIGDGRQGAVRFRRAEILAWIEAGCPRVDGASDR